MFEVRFYTFSKRNNSTKQPLSIQDTSFNCDIRNVSNILNPSIELKHDNPTNFNYCFIQEFERYYFISNWTFNQGLWIASCSVDVLATYKTPIGNTEKYVLRSYSSKNGNVIDNMFPMLAETTTQEQSIFPFSNTAMTMDDGVIVIGVVGANEQGQTMYQITPTQFKSLLKMLLTTADGYDWGDLTQGVINSLMNPLQFLVSCRWYPKAFIYGTGENLSFGNWHSNVMGYPIIMNAQQDIPYVSIPNAFSINKHPQSLTKGQYLNLRPFTKSIIDLGVFGLADLDQTLLYDRQYIYIQIFVDAFSGIGTIKGWAENNGVHTYDRLLFKKDIQFGINIPLSANDSNAIPSILNATLGLASGNIDFGAIGDVVKSMTGTVETSSSSGSIIQHLQKFRLMQNFMNQSDIDYLNFGYPLMRNVVLNTLNGFILCKDGNIELSCTDTEKEKIKQYLEQGFYYE